MERSAPRVRPCYYLISAAGFPNYGDELIAARWLEHLARVAPDADVWLDCPHPGNASVLLDGRHPRARFVDTAWQLCWHAPVESPMDVASWVQSVVREPGLAARWLAGTEVIARADVVHVLGGGFVTDQWPRHVGVLAAARAAARRSGGRAVATGAGLTPASAVSARLMSALLADFAVVDVRDAPTAALVPDVGAGVTGDDALLARGTPHPEAASAPSHMLCLQSDLISDDEARDLAAWVLATLRRWGVPPSDVGIVEGIPAHDRLVYSLIEHDLVGARFYPFSEVWDRGLPAAPHQTWLSTRFHVHQEASRAGASGLALTTGSDYYATKHASLVERGSGWTVVADRTSLPERPAGAFDPAELTRLQVAKRGVAAAIYPSSSVAAGGADGRAPSNGRSRPAVEGTVETPGRRARWQRRARR